MREVPDCLNRRYKALDDLIQELSMAVSSQNFESRTKISDDPSIKLMCEFWDILKQDPDCNLTQAVKHHMGLSSTNSTVFGPRHVTCYMAESSKKKCGGNKKCCHKSAESSKNVSPKSSKDKIEESGSTRSCKKCAGKEPKINDTALKIKDSEEDMKEIPLMVIKDEVSYTPKVTPLATPKVASKESVKEVTSKICCKHKLERKCCKDCKDKMERSTPRVAIKEGPIITVPCKDVEKRETSKVPCKDKVKEIPMTPCRDIINIREPMDKYPIKDKSKEVVGALIEDTCSVNAKESCKSCSFMEKIKRICGSVRPTPPRHDCGQGPQRTDSSPLGKALCNLKEAASHDKQCNAKIQDLMENQAQLKSQIQKLEERENVGLEMIKKADCMWTCMEDCYKKKLEDSQHRQKELLKELKKVEQNNNKWRKNNKELEFQMGNLSKVQQEMSDKINQKKNDIKIILAEIGNLQKRVDNSSKETDSIKKSMENRKNASNVKVSNYSVEMNKFQSALMEERKIKLKKEEEGAKYIKEARSDLQQIAKLLLQKRLQNEDMRAEKKALEDEIELLKQTLDQCKDKCSLKKKRIEDEIQKVTDEIAVYQVKCIRCHVCTDTEDIRKLCTDCPKCERERECIVEGEHCVIDPTMDCVCQSVKQKFLDNVFENMYTVLARQSKSPPGKALADVILKCLKKSTNGKLNDETRKLLQEFILTTVRKNLNLTIIGGAVKTRCEMDSDTYNQLMSCLKDVEMVPPAKEDKGTDVKKASCRRWGGSNECNCPHGPKACVCTRKAPPPLEEPGPNPPPDADDPAEIVKCPHKESTSCGVDCAMHAAPNVSNETDVWKRDPCKSPTSCTFTTNMRAAQCVLGPESLMNISKRQNLSPVMTISEDIIKGLYGEKSKRPCACRQDHSGRPRERIIEEVMGTNTDMSPIEKVSNDENYTKTKKDEKRLLADNILLQMSKHPNRSENIHKCDCGSDWIYINSAEALKEMLLQKKDTHICHTKQDSSTGSKNKGRCTNEIKVVFDVTKKNKSLSATKHSKTKNNKRLISKTTKELMRDVMVSGVNKDEYNDYPKIMTIDAFIKQISSDSNSLASDVSDVGIDCKSLNDTFWNAKQLKAGIRAKSTEKRFLIDYKDKHDAYTEISSKVRYSPIKNEQIGKEFKIFSKDDKKKLKIIVDKNKSNSNISLTKTPSGNLGIVLNENTVKIIDQMTLIDPQLVACLSRDKKLTFHYEKSDDDNEYSVLIKRTSSGTRQLEVDSQFIAAFNKNNFTETAIKIHTNKKKHDENTSVTDLISLKNGNNNKTSSISKILNKMYGESKSMKLTVQGENGLKKSIDAPLTRTLSGKIAVAIDKVLSLGEIASNLKELPVKVNRTKTGSLLLNITKCDNNSNAVIKKTSSGSLLLLPTEPCLKYPDSGYSQPKENYFGLKIKDKSSSIPELQLMIKPTSSQKYLIVFDKEYETSYKTALKHCMRDSSDCFVKMSTTKSCNFEIKMDEVNDFNARLVISQSGNIKIIPEESKVNLSNKKKVKTLHDLLESLPIMIHKPHKSTNASRLITKSNSDSRLLDRVRILTPDNKEFSLQPSELKKTDSGQYAIILDKSSKKRFINNLKYYLKNNCHGLIPVNRTNPGEITIVLGNEYNKKSEYGALKVTHSGNIYLIQNTLSKVDKNINVNETNSFLGQNSQHYIDKVKQPVNKSTATNCYANPDPCFCDSSKCLCAKLHKCTKDVKENIKKDKNESITSKDIKESIMSFYRPKMCGVDWKYDVKKKSEGNYKTIDDSNRCNISLDNENVSSDADTSYKVIKKCNAIPPVFPNHSHSTEQCYFVDTICSYHVGQYTCVSNHLLEIPVVCDKPVANNVVSRRATLNNVEWESLEHSPPHLPYFLTQRFLT